MLESTKKWTKKGLYLLFQASAWNLVLSKFIFELIVAHKRTLAIGVIVVATVIIVIKTAVIVVSIENNGAAKKILSLKTKKA